MRALEIDWKRAAVPCWLLLILFLVFPSTSVAQTAVGVADERATTSADLEVLMSRMTLEEKIGQLNMLTGFWDMTGPVPQEGDANDQYMAIRSGRVGAMLNVTGVKSTRAAQRFAVEESRLKIPLLFGYDVIHGYRTMFPLPLAESCSWNLELIERTARAAAEEAARDGVNWTFAPMVDISRDARWGRVMEGAGEDPWLGAAVAKARVRGFQGDDLAATETIAACAKHFAGYGFTESGREYNTVDISGHTLQNVVLPPFRACVEARVATFMTAFNELAGVPATADRALLQGVLRDDLGFAGMVVSDYASCRQLLKHGFAASPSQAARLSLQAGCDMDMEGRIYITELHHLVTSGEMPVSYIDQAVRRILQLKMQLGLFEDPFRYGIDTTEVADQTQHQELAREAARQSIVMLHNRRQLLPLDKDRQSIAVIGPLAKDKDAPLGNWRAQAIENSAISLLEAVQIEFANRGEVRHTDGCHLLMPGAKRGMSWKSRVNEENREGIAEAAKLAAQCDLVLLVVGEDCYQSGEARSRSRIGLPGVQSELVRAVTEANEDTVMLVMSGRPLVLTDEIARVGAALQVWHLGSQAGPAIVDVLSGRHNPSGKLTMSFPRSVGQLPIYYNHKNTGRPTSKTPDEVWYSHFSDEQNEPLFPFGHGESYTEFHYQNLRIDRERFNENETVTISVDLRNVGKVDGTEIVQLYVRDLVASRTRPVRELKAFARTQLAAGEERQIDFVLDRSAFGYFDDAGSYRVEPGEFHVFVGGNSDATSHISCFLEKQPTSDGNDK